MTTTPSYSQHDTRTRSVQASGEKANALQGRIEVFLLWQEFAAFLLSSIHIFVFILIVLIVVSTLLLSQENSVRHVLLVLTLLRLERSVLCERERERERIRPIAKQIEKMKTHHR